MCGSFSARRHTASSPCYVQLWHTLTYLYLFVARAARPTTPSLPAHASVCLCRTRSVLNSADLVCVAKTSTLLSAKPFDWRTESRYPKSFYCFLLVNNEPLFPKPIKIVLLFTELIMHIILPADTNYCVYYYIVVDKKNYI